MRGQGSRYLSAVLVMAWAGPNGAGSPPEARGYWWAGELGVASVQLSSSEGTRSPRAFALGFEGGVSLNAYVDLGLRLNGWTIQASNLNDPSEGESLSQVLVVLRVQSGRGEGFFIRAGTGYGSYTNHHPSAFGGRGWGTSLGLGYQHRLTPKIQVVPCLNFRGGSWGDVDNAIAKILDRRYRAVDFSFGIRFP